jgi:hypothetical protein
VAAVTIEAAAEAAA